MVSQHHHLHLHQGHHPTNTELWPFKKHKNHKKQSYFPFNHIMQLIYKTELIPFEWYCTVNDPRPKKKF